MFIVRVEGIRFIQRNGQIFHKGSAISLKVVF